MREIFLGIIFILFIVCYFKAGLCIRTEKQYGVLILGVMFFILRDFLIMLYLQTTSNKKRIGAAFILYLFLLYVVFPGLTSTLGNHTILQIFIPLPIAGSFLFPLVECALIFYIIRSKFK